MKIGVLQPLREKKAKWFADAIPWLFAHGQVPMIVIYLLEGEPPEIRPLQRLLGHDPVSAIQEPLKGHGLYIRTSNWVLTFYHEITIDAFHTIYCRTCEYARDYSIRNAYIALVPQNEVTENLLKVWDFAREHQRLCDFTVSDFAKQLGHLTPHSLADVYRRKVRHENMFGRNSQ